MKKYLTLLIVVILLGGSLFFVERSPRQPATSGTFPTSTVTIALSEPAANTPVVSIPRSVPPPVGTTAVPAPSRNTIPVTFLVGSTTYSAEIPVGANVLDTMNILASTTPLTFTAHMYPSMGYFVDSINGVKNANGSYWLLYVNGVETGAGASQTFPKANDTVEWRYKVFN